MVLNWLCGDGQETIADTYHPQRFSKTMLLGVRAGNAKSEC